MTAEEIAEAAEFCRRVAADFDRWLPLLENPKVRERLVYIATAVALLGPPAGEA